MRPGGFGLIPIVEDFAVAVVGGDGDDEKWCYGQLYRHSWELYFHRLVVAQCLVPAPEIRMLMMLGTAVRWIGCSFEFDSRFHLAVGVNLRAGYLLLDSGFQGRCW